MIMPISQKLIIQNYKASPKNVEIGVQPPRNFISEKQINLPFMGDSKVYSDQIQALKEEMKEFPKDIEYRKTLMVHAGKKPYEAYKLRSIIGPGEIKSIMKDFNESEEVYSTGVDDKNIRDKTIRANLHMHTLASDGFLSTEELLNKAARYADEVAQNPKSKKEPFTVAITDHDTTESAKEAIEIIAENPLKYKNLRVILGVEFTTYNNIATDIVKRAVDTHMLVYGINPYETNFEAFIENNKNGKEKILDKMIDQANETYKDAFNTKKDFFSTDEAKEMYNPLKKKICGIFNSVESYVGTKILLDDVVLKHPTLIKKLYENNLPIDTKGLMTEMKNFNYRLDKNNKSRSGVEMVSEFLTHKAFMDEDEIKEILKETPKSKEFESFHENIKPDLEQFKRTINPKYDYMPTIKNIFEVLSNQESVIAGIAHPLDSTKYIKDESKKLEFLKEQYTQFKEWGQDKAVFTEVYYQSYPEKLKEFQDSEDTKELLNELSDNLDLYKTGSADTHRTNIFKRLY